MSILLDDTTLTLNTKATISTEGYAFQDLDWIVLTNASPFACHVTTGGITLLLPAWYYFPIPLHDQQGRVLPGLALPFNVTPYLQTIPGAGFTNVLHTELYTRGTTPPNTQPTPLGGGPIDLTIASQIISSNQPPGQNIIFAEPTGDTNPSGVATLTNSGVLLLGDTTYSGKIELSGTHVALAATNSLFPDEITLLGTTNQELDLLLFGTDAFITMKNVAGSSVVILQTTSPNLDLSGSNAAVGILTKGSIKSPNGSNLILDTNAGTDSTIFKNNNVDICKVINTGFTLDSGTLSFLAGSVSRIKFGFIGVVTTGTAITHGLGATPQVVLTQPGSNFTCFVDTVGATTFTAHPSVNGNIWWLAAFA